VRGSWQHKKMILSIFKKFEAGISTLFNLVKLVAKVSWGLIPPPFFIKLKQYYQKARKLVSD
jgi:hypothetical protein